MGAAAAPAAVAGIPPASSPTSFPLLLSGGEVRTGSYLVGHCRPASTLPKGHPAQGGAWSFQSWATLTRLSFCLPALCGSWRDERGALMPGGGNGTRGGQQGCSVSCPFSEPRWVEGGLTHPSPLATPSADFLFGRVRVLSSVWDHWVAIAIRLHYWWGEVSGSYAHPLGTQKASPLAVGTSGCPGARRLLCLGSGSGAPLSAQGMASLGPELFLEKPDLFPIPVNLGNLHRPPARELYPVPGSLLAVVIFSKWQRQCQAFSWEAGNGCV